MTLMLLAMMALGAAEKPTVSLEESCRKAATVLVVESTADASECRVREVLFDGTAARLQADDVLDVDLKGMKYETGRAYILFMEPTEEAGRYRAVPQMRTEDGKETRERVLKLLAPRKAERKEP